jgi:hypothetical protein
MGLRKLCHSVRIDGKSGKVVQRFLGVTSEYFYLLEEMFAILVEHLSGVVDRLRNNVWANCGPQELNNDSFFIFQRYNCRPACALRLRKHLGRVLLYKSKITYYSKTRETEARAK